MVAPSVDRSDAEFAAAYSTVVTQVQISQDLLAQLQDPAIATEARDRAPDRANLTDLQASLSALLDSVSQALAQDADKPPRLAAIDIEIRKQLRLIQIDSQFLGTARQPATLTARLESIRAHLELLDRYGQGALLLLDRA